MATDQAPNNITNIPSFGNLIEGEVYDPRPGAYAILFNGDGLVAVEQTPAGYYLPGGGAEPGETTEETLRREVREECGCEIVIDREICQAIEYIRSPGHLRGVSKIGTYFVATVGAAADCALYDDHITHWVDIRDAAQRLVHQSQVWAVQQVIDSQGK